MEALLNYFGLPCPLKLFLGRGKNSVSCQEVKKLLNNGYTYLDVRTPEEFAEGHILDAINVPYKLKYSKGMVKNEEFEDEVAAKFNKDAQLVVGCQGGLRSTSAVKELKALGYVDVVEMGSGYAGWVRTGLPTIK